jgi:hypothetical protein
MFDPIIDDSIRIEDKPFTKEVVEDFVKGRPSSSKFPSRHYSQLTMLFDEELIVKSLKKFGIPTTGKALIFGGYTGQFARSLKKIGMRVIFTDPMHEWIEEARKEGFESYKYSAEGIPWKLIQNSQLTAAFECYFPFNNENTFLYTTLRFLIPDYGLLYGESQRTRDELFKEAGGKRGGQLRSAFGPFNKVYGVETRQSETGDFRLFNLSASQPVKKKILMDCQVAKILYDSYPIDALISRESVSQISESAGLEAYAVLESLERLFKVYQLNLKRYGQTAMFIPDDEFCLFSKRFKFVLD